MSGDRPRSVFFCNFPPPVTGQTVGTELVAELLEPSAEIVRLDTSDGRMSVGRSPLDIAKRVLSLRRSRRELEQELDRVRPDVLYFVVSSSVLGQLRDAMVVRTARPRVARIIAHVRSGNYQGAFDRLLSGRLARQVASGVDRFIFLSEHLSRLAEAHIPAEKRVVVPNAIDQLVRLRPEEAAEKIESRAARESLRVVFIANMIPSKGYMDVARGLAHLCQGGKVDVEADFVGAWPSDESRAKFARFVAENSLERTLRVHGSVHDRAWIRSLLAESDVLALPTYYPVEAQPRSIIEALNAAVPVVATRHASIPEYVTDAENGFLVPARSPEAIAEAFEKLAEPATWRRMATAARTSYERLFDPSVIGEQLASVFRGEA